METKSKARRPKQPGHVMGLVLEQFQLVLGSETLGCSLGKCHPFTIAVMFHFHRRQLLCCSLRNPWRWYPSQLRSFWLSEVTKKEFLSPTSNIATWSKPFACKLSLGSQASPQALLSHRVAGNPWQSEGFNLYIHNSCCWSQSSSIS